MYRYGIAALLMWMLTVGSLTGQQQESSSAEVVYWNSIYRENNPDLFRAYLKRYPNGQFIEIAQAKLASLANGGITPERLPPPEPTTPDTAAVPPSTQWPVHDGTDATCVGTLVLDVTSVTFSCQSKKNRMDVRIPTENIIAVKRDGDSIVVHHGAPVMARFVAGTTTSKNGPSPDGIAQAAQMFDALEDILFYVHPNRDPITIPVLHKHGVFTFCEGQLTAQMHALVFAAKKHTFEWVKEHTTVRLRPKDIGWDVEVIDEHHTKTTFSINYYEADPPFRSLWGKPRINGAWEEW